MTSENIVVRADAVGVDGAPYSRQGDSHLSPSFDTRELPSAKSDRGIPPPPVSALIQPVDTNDPAMAENRSRTGTRCRATVKVRIFVRQEISAPSPADPKAEPCPIVAGARRADHRRSAYRCWGRLPGRRARRTRRSRHLNRCRPRINASADVHCSARSATVRANHRQHALSFQNKLCQKTLAIKITGAFLPPRPRAVSLSAASGIHGLHACSMPYAS